MKEYHNRAIYNIKIDDIEGNPHELNAKIISPAQARAIYKIATDEKYNLADKVIDQMVLLFGKEKPFYEKFDVFVMNEVLTDAVNDIVLKKNN